MNKVIIVSIIFSVATYAKCYKTIEEIRYKEQLSLNQNIMRVKCNNQTENISIEDKYAKYYLKSKEFITKDKIVEIKPKKIIFRVNESIEFTTNGEIVEKSSGYLKIKKPNQEIKKYRIK